MRAASSAPVHSAGKTPPGAPWRWPVRAALALAALIALSAALVFSVLHTEWGARALWQVAMYALPEKLSGEVTGGTLDDGLQLRNLVYRDTARQVKIDRLSARWNWSRSPLALTVNDLRIGEFDLTLFPTPPQPPSPPWQITLPLAIDVRSAALQKLVIRRDGSATAISDIRLQARSDRVHHALTLEHADTPYGTARARLSLDGRSPFAAVGAADLDGAWRDEHYRLEMNLSGTLQALDMQLQASGDRLSGNAHIEAAPFAAVPLRRAQVRLRKLNPQAFNAAAPQAELDIDASLAPANSDAQAGKDASQLTLAGPVSIRNARPGSLDRSLLPIISARAEVRLDAQQQQLRQLQAHLSGGATLEGDGELRSDGTGRFALQASALDLHALHGKLKPSRLNGPLSVELADGAQRIALKLAGPSLAVNADALVTAQQMTLNNALLQAGAARLNISGTLSRDAQRAYAVRGSLSDFNPALVIAAAERGKPPQARINMDFDAQGALQPELAAQLRFAIRDSSYAGLPMTGGGSLRLAGKRILASDAQLSVAGNRLQLAGSFGAPGERLKFSIEAPALARLGLGLSGLLQAGGELGGSVERPEVDAHYRAGQLMFREYRIEQLSGQVSTSGVPGRNPDARVMLELTARGAQSGDVRLTTLNATVNGSYADHDITVDAGGQLRGRPLALTLAAQGRLQEQPQGYAWDGSLRTLENHGFPRLTLAGPLAVSVAPQRFVLGAARLTLEQAQIELKGLRIEDRLISSEGGFSALDVRHVLELRREITGAEPPLNTDLVLDGRWKFSLADTADGFFQVEQRSGDVRVLSGARESALGLTVLRLRGDLQGRLIRLGAQLDAGRIGSAGATGQIALQAEDGRLMPSPDSALAGRITASIPRLQSITALAGPRITLDGSAGIDLSVAGTLADPVLSGDASGRNLALTLYDQGVHLHDGSAQIRLDNNLVDIQQLVFHGGAGTLRATGRIPLDRSSPDLSATIVADHLQLLANPSGQVTVSGQASAVNVNRQLQIGGKFTVDRARFQLPEESAPALDDDVVVIRGKERIAASGKRAQAAPASEKAAGPLTPVMSVEIDLGDDFRFEGSGADLLLAGTLTVKSAPGEPPQAFGTVRIVNGTYEAFGAKLAIERGAINFQGPFANPDITILAMRRNQDVAAGVQVTGTVRQPRVQLVSEPDVPEQEKLNWLVFGRGNGTADAGPGQAQAAAREATLGLLNKFGGARIAKGFGLDQLAIGSSEFGLGAQQVVSLGKEISNRLFIGYEQSLAGAAGVLKLTYELSRHWSVVVRGGTIGGVEVFYSKRFDTLGGAGERQ